MGKLVIADQLAQQYSELLARSRDDSIPLWELERDEFGADHAVVGGYLAGLWGFPHPVVEALLYHHQPAEGFSEGPDVLALVHMANGLEHLARGRPEPGEVDVQFLERLGLAERFEEWRETTREERDGP